MMAFPAYDLDKLLHTSYCRVGQLFVLAMDASDMRKYEMALGGAALHDSKLGNQLRQVELESTVTEQGALDDVMSDASKLQAAAAVQKMLDRRRKESGGV